jgi:hypothetical protein
MSKNTALQTAPAIQPEKKEKQKKLFGLSVEELSMVVGGTGVIVTAQKK